MTLGSFVLLLPLDKYRLPNIINKLNVLLSITHYDRNRLPAMAAWLCKNTHDIIPGRIYLAVKG